MATACERHHNRAFRPSQGHLRAVPRGRDTPVQGHGQLCQDGRAAGACPLKTLRVLAPGTANDSPVPPSCHSRWLLHAPRQLNSSKRPPVTAHNPGK